MAKGKGEPPLRLPDTWEANALFQMAQAMGKWLSDDRVDWSKPLDKLSLREMMGCCWAAMCVYTELRDQKRREMRLSVFDDEAIDDLGLVLRRSDVRNSGSS